MKPIETDAQILAEVGLRLVQQRLDQGLTQAQLAERAGVKEIEISRFETGRAIPSADLKRRLTELLRKPAFELFDC